MAAYLLNRQPQILGCPKCDHREPAQQFQASTDTAYQGQFHHCAGLKGVIAPLIPEGESAKTEVVDREDYEGRELVQRDGDGRPVMAVHTTRDDTEHRVVLPPTAQARGES